MANDKTEQLAEATIEKIINMSLEEIEKMTDEQWLEYIQPCLEVQKAVDVAEVRQKSTKTAGSKRVKLSDLKPRTKSSQSIIDRLRRERDGGKSALRNKMEKLMEELS